LWEDLNKCGVIAVRNTYIANGVDLEEADRVVARDEKPGGTAIVGYVGQLIERKNIPVLLEAFRIAIRKKGNLQLLIVGDGPLRQDLRAASEAMGIADRVRFSGYCDDALALMKMFDVFVLPSQLEGIPRCVMEAMALGVPVVASDIPGNRELVEHLRTGILFPANAPGKLSEAILFVLDGTDEVQEMCRRARQRIEDKFSAKRMAAEYSFLYRKLSGDPDRIRR
jgi:glycosyltransferase involved in cell wall biosynthesis